MRVTSKSQFKRIIAVLICLIITLNTIEGCGKNNSEGQVETLNVDQTTEIDTEVIANVITNEIKKELDSKLVQNGNEHIYDISTAWEDYVGDVDTFVYGLLTSEYGLCYDVFNACIELDDGTTVFGLAYTDYEGVFETDDGDTYFPAGFLTLIGEDVIAKEDIDSGLEIINLDVEDEYGFLYTYETEPFYEHCVIWDHYLKYGVDENGVITYEVKEYSREVCDESLGALYSYDDNRYLYDPDVGEYVYLSGESLFAEIDYSELEEKVNKILEEQDSNFSQIDVQSSAFIAQEAVNSFFLAMQEESFMGYKVKDLIAASEKIDPMECIQLTSEGMVIVNTRIPVGEGPTELVKWVTGISCGIVVVTCLAADIFCPALLPLTGAISASAVEVFMQVVANNQSYYNLNWAKVGVSAAAGALLAWCCPMLANAATSGAVRATNGVVKILGKTVNSTALRAIGNLSGYSVLAVSNAVVSGATGAAFALLDGGNENEAFEAFKMGALIGGAFTIAIPVLSAGAKGIGQKIIKHAKPNGFLLKLTGKVGDVADKAGAFIKKKQIHFKNKDIEKILVPKSIHQATEAAIAEVQKGLGGGDMVLDNKIKNLPADRNENFVLKDTDGNVIKKNDLIAKKGNGSLSLSDNCDPDVAKAWKELGIEEIQIRNGDPQFGQYSEYSFTPEAGITSNRNSNMENFRKELADSWTVNNDLIPNKVKDELVRRNIPLDNFTADDLQDVFSALKLTLHEGTDGKVYLMSRPLHESIRHYGGVALAKTIEKITIGTQHFKDLCASTVAAITGTLIAEGVN